MNELELQPVLELVPVIYCVVQHLCWLSSAVESRLLAGDDDVLIPNFVEGFSYLVTNLVQ